MSEINWGALEHPDFAVNALKADALGRRDATEQAKQNALRGYAANPDASISQLMAVDPEAALQMQRARREERAQAARADAGAKYASGDHAGAQTAAAQAGDFDLAASIANMDEASRKAAHGRADVLASVGFSLRQLPYDQRRQRLMAMGDQFKDLGLTAEQLAGFDPSDANIDAQVSQALSIKDQLDNADREADNKRGDAQLTETQRHNRKAEANAAATSATSAYSARTGRMSFEARKKAGGFGTPGAGAVIGPQLDGEWQEDQ